MRFSAARAWSLDYGAPKGAAITRVQRTPRHAGRYGKLAVVKGSCGVAESTVSEAVTVASSLSLTLSEEDIALLQANPDVPSHAALELARVSSGKVQLARVSNELHPKPIPL